DVGVLEELCPPADLDAFDVGQAGPGGQPGHQVRAGVLTAGSLAVDDLDAGVLLLVLGEELFVAELVEGGDGQFDIASLTSPSAAPGTGAACSQRGSGGGGGRGGQGGPARELHDELPCSLADLVPASALMMLGLRALSNGMSVTLHDLRAMSPPPRSRSGLARRRRRPAQGHAPAGEPSRPELARSRQRSRPITRSSPGTSTHCPPRCTWARVTNPAAVAWYQGKLAALLEDGVDCFKSDFGERIPTDVVWHDGSDPVRMHNYYAHLYNKVVFEVLEEWRGEGEAVLFARTATAGGQQFPVHWGGDCESTFEAMAQSLRGGLSLVSSGSGYWSHDIGGFEGTPDPAVFKRWVASGCCPRTRACTDRTPTGCPGCSTRRRSRSPAASPG